MAIQDIIQRFIPQGDSQLQQAYQNNARAAGTLESSIEKMARAVHDSARAYQNAAQQYGAGSDEANRAAQAFRKASSTLKAAESDFAATADVIRRVDDSLSGAADRAIIASTKFESMRNVGAAIGASGAGALVLSERFIGAGIEADRLNAKMKTLLSGAGIGSAADQIADIGKSIAELTGGDDDAIALAITRAIASGRTMGLREFGIDISKSGQAAITAAYKINDLAGRQETLRQVTEAATRAIKDMRENTSAAAQEMGRAGVAIGNMEEQIGLGAAEAKARVTELGMSMAGIATNSPDGQKTFGGILYYAGLAASIIGGGLGIVGQIGLAKIAFTTLGGTATATGATVAGAATGMGASIGGLAAAGGPIALAIGALVALGIAAKDAINLTRQAGQLSDENLIKREGLTGRAVIGMANAISPSSQEGTDPQAAALFAKLRQRAPANQAAINAARAATQAQGRTAMAAQATSAVAGWSSDTETDETGTRTTKGERAQRAAIRAAERDAKRVEREHARAAKAAERATAKLTKQRERDAEEKQRAADKLADATNDHRIAVEIARSTAQHEKAVALLEASKTDENARSVEYKIKALEAARIQREAAIRGENQDIAGIQAGSILERAAIAFNTPGKSKSSPDLSSFFKMPNYADMLSMTGLAAPARKMRSVVNGAGNFLTGGNASYVGGGALLDPYAQSPNRGGSRPYVPKPDIKTLDDGWVFTFKVPLGARIEDVRAAANLARDFGARGWG